MCDPEGVGGLLDASGAVDWGRPDARLVVARALLRRDYFGFLRLDRPFANFIHSFIICERLCPCVPLPGQLLSSSTPQSTRTWNLEIIS